MKSALFKSIVSKIELSLGEWLGYSGPEGEEAIKSGCRPMLVNPMKPELKTINNVKQTEINIIEEMETYKV